MGHRQGDRDRQGNVPSPPPLTQVQHHVLQQTKEEEGRSKGLVEATTVIQERDVVGLGQAVLGRWSQCLAVF